MNFKPYQKIKAFFALKIFLIFSLVLFIFFISLTMLFISYESDSLKNNLIQTGKMLTEIFANNSRLGLFSENKIIMNNAILSIFKERSVLEVSVFNKDQKIFMQKIKKTISDKKESKNYLFQTLEKKRNIIFFENTNGIEFFSSVFKLNKINNEEDLFIEKDSDDLNNDLLGFVSLTIDKSLLNYNVKRILKVSILLWLFFTLLGSGVIFFIAKKMTTPLKRLNEKVKTLEHGKLAEFNELQVITDDEVGELTKAFNNMAKALIEREQKLIQSEDNLKFERNFLAQRVDDQVKELTVLNAELSRSAKLKDEFLANMSHELRTPLTSILGMSEILLEELYGPLNEKQRSYLETVEKSGNHLLSLINDILDVSKIDADSMKLDFSGIDVKYFCESVIRMIKQTALKKNLKITTSFNNKNSILYADNVRLKQILVNLLSNAVKFTNEGGKIGLNVTDDFDSRSTVFRVWDTGIGIKAKDINLLFKPFSQIDSSLSRKYVGSGLGLVLAKRLTQLHGGDIKLESVEGVGSSFIINIPWREMPTYNEVLSEDKFLKTPEVKSYATPCCSYLILVVDDNKDNIFMISNYIEHKGYKVIVAQNGNEAVDMAMNSNPDLILMDIQMPGMDGLEAIMNIRLTNKKVPIFAVTALAMAGDKERCIESGANNYFIKPINLKEMLAAIEKELANYSCKS